MNIVITSCGNILRGYVLVAGKEFRIESNTDKTWVNIIDSAGCCEASDAVCNIDHNNRDYYMYDREVWEQSRKEMMEVRAALNAAHTYFMDVCMHLQEFIKE